MKKVSLSLVILLSVVVLAILVGTTSQIDLLVISQIRLPRVLMAACTGAGLALAGAILQVLFYNPLCEPYTLGISSGSALGAVLGAALGVDFIYFGLVGSSFIGALVFTGILYFLSRKRDFSSLALLLSGVALSFLGSSLVALCMTLFDLNGIQGALIWLLGDLSRARPQGAVIMAGSVLILFRILYARRTDLDALLLGEETAKTLGFDSKRIRMQLLLWTSLLVGLCVSAAGMIGFVGLIVPHMVRRLIGSLHSKVLPLTMIWGAVVLVLGDLLSRILYPPYEIPVGVVTALVGAPWFLLLVLRRSESVHS